jgi:hypothetical protein
MGLVERLWKSPGPKTDVFACARQMNYTVVLCDMKLFATRLRNEGS